MCIKERYKQVYMDVTKRFAELSHCERKKVATIIVKDDNIISFGWNGTPRGFDNCCEEWIPNTITRDMVQVTKSNVIHAEQNALMKLASSNESSEGASLFVTMAPCSVCALLIIQAKIKEVYYSEIYRDDSGLKILEQAGIYTKQL